MEENKKIKSGIFTDKIVLIVALIAIVIIFSGFNPNYLSSANLINILVASAVTGLVAIAETYFIIALLIDLSPGSVAAFSSVLIAILLKAKVSFWLAVIIVIAAGLIIGLINGLVINKLKIEPFIATLATQSIFRGMAYIICNGNPVAIMDPAAINFGNKRYLGLPISVIILIISFIVFGIILSKTRFGRSIYVIGGNKEAARLAGLKPQKITLISFVIAGALAALGGIILATRMSSGQPAAAVGLEFDAITGAVLGGAAFSGGVGDMFGTVIGVLILQCFNTGLIMLNVPTFWQFVARGALLLIALAFDYFRKKNREKKLLAQSMAQL